MKLKKEHSAPYLPYELKIRVFSNTQPPYNTTLNCAFLEDMTGVKLILKPLSDLYKIKGKNGKTLPEMWKEHDAFSSFFLEYDEITLDKIPTIQYKVIISLLENHYDIYGLIENGLAVNINTLK